MQEMLDLFGNPVELKTNSKPKTQPKPRAKVILDRHKLWADGGYLAELEEEDDDEVPIHSVECFTENATIERLEKALFMAPVIKGGKWVYEGTFWAYRLVKPVIGQRQLGKSGTILREANQYLVTSSANKVLEETYNDTGAWLPRYAYWLFCHRIRMADESEDPYELLKAFTATMTQHDYLDASRKGDSLRRVIKRQRMQEKRAAARKDVAAEVDDSLLKTA